MTTRDNLFTRIGSFFGSIFGRGEGVSPLDAEAVLMPEPEGPADPLWITRKALDAAIKERAAAQADLAKDIANHGPGPRQPIRDRLKYWTHEELELSLILEEAS